MRHIDERRERYRDEQNYFPYAKNDDHEQKQTLTRTTIRSRIVPSLNKRYLNEAMFLNLVLITLVVSRLFIDIFHPLIHITAGACFLLSIILFGRSFSKSRAPLANVTSMVAAVCYLVGFGSHFYCLWIDPSININPFAFLLPLVGAIASALSIVYTLIKYGKE